MAYWELWPRHMERVSMFVSYSGVVREWRTTPYSVVHSADVRMLLPVQAVHIEDMKLISTVLEPCMA